METKTVLERYAYYYNVLQKLGTFKLLDSPTLEDLSVAGGMVQRAYREMKSENFDGNLIDYFCYLSMHFLIFQAGNEKKENLSELTKHIIFKGLETDRNNFLRLFHKNPYVYFDNVSKEGLELKHSTFLLLSNAWFLYTLKERYPEHNQKIDNLFKSLKDG